MRCDWAERAEPLEAPAAPARVSVTRALARSPSLLFPLPPCSSSTAHTCRVMSHSGIKTFRQCGGMCVFLARWSPSECHFCMVEPGMDSMTPAKGPPSSVSSRRVPAHGGHRGTRMRDPAYRSAPTGSRRPGETPPADTTASPCRAKSQTRAS